MKWSEFRVLVVEEMLTRHGDDKLEFSTKKNKGENSQRLLPWWPSSRPSGAISSELQTSLQPASQNRSIVSAQTERNETNSSP